ncbi:MAG: hypothetical protein CBE26_03165 [Kiritimatiellaceae bacterium TMED266]|nr:MAG: hypothetical protein CBE26_03165 [Kiritimatiellaceae bacterium TMED266]
MFKKSKIINVMEKNGFSLNRDCEELCLHGDYARNIQLVFSNQNDVNEQMMTSRMYMAVDLYREKLVIGLIREFEELANGVVLNTTGSIKLMDFNEENVDKLVKQLLVKR